MTMIDKNNLMICIEAWECHTDAVTLKELTGMNKDEFFSTAKLFDDADLISQDYFEGYTLDEAIREAKAYAKKLPKPRVERKSYSSNRPEEVVFTYVSLLIYDEDYDSYEQLSTMFDTDDLGLYTNAIAAGVTERYDPTRYTKINKVESYKAERKITDQTVKDWKEADSYKAPCEYVCLHDVVDNTLWEGEPWDLDDIHTYDDFYIVDEFYDGVGLCILTIKDSIRWESYKKERYDPYFDADIDTSNFTPQTPVPLKSLKNGEYFTLKDIPQPKDSQVWVKGEWDKYDKEWVCYKFSDVNQGKGFKGNKMVYTDFLF